MWNQGVGMLDDVGCQLVVEGGCFGGWGIVQVVGQVVGCEGVVGGGGVDDVGYSFGCYVLLDMFQVDVGWQCVVFDSDFGYWQGLGGGYGGIQVGQVVQGLVVVGGDEGQC